MHNQGRNPDRIAKEQRYVCEQHKSGHAGRDHNGDQHGDHTCSPAAHYRESGTQIAPFLADSARVEALFREP